MELYHLGEKIATQRKSKHWTQKDLAAQLFVSDKLISKWECGHAIPDFVYIVKLSELFGVDLEYFTEGDFAKQRKLQQTRRRTRRVLLIVNMCTMCLPLLVAVLADVALPQSIPMHYDALGNITRWGDKSEMIHMGLVLSAIPAAMFGGLYFAERKFADRNPKFWIAYICNFCMILTYTVMQIAFTVKAAREASAAAYEPIWIRDFVIIALCALLYWVGAACLFVPPNGILGYRFPWTAPPWVWYRTHRVSGAWILAASVAAWIGIGYSRLAAPWWLGLPLPACAAGILISLYYAKRYKSQVVASEAGDSDHGDGA